MPSDTAICNNALRKVAAGRITSLFESSKRAKVCNQIYTRLRDDELRSHVWNFAKAKATLIATTTPISGFEYAHVLPDDWIRTVGVWGDDAQHSQPRYAILRQTIESDFQDIWLTYIRRVANPAVMDSLFRRALAYRIAMEIAPAIEGVDVSRETLERDYAGVIREARSVDAIEDYPEQLPIDDWIAVRA